MTRLSPVLDAVDTCAYRADALTRCNDIATYRLLIVCVHEHARWIGDCDEHRNSVGTSACYECLTCGEEPHYCPLTVVHTEPVERAA